MILFNLSKMEATLIWGVSLFDSFINSYLLLQAVFWEFPFFSNKRPQDLREEHRSYLKTAKACNTTGKVILSSFHRYRNILNISIIFKKRSKIMGFFFFCIFGNTRS